MTDNVISIDFTKRNIKQETTPDVETPFDYKALMSPRSVALVMIKEIVRRVAKHGISDDRAIHIRFDVQIVGVDVPPQWSRASDLTIILNRHHRDLVIDDDCFSVRLFIGVPTTVVVPWNAVLSLSDPKASFELKQ